MSFEDDNCLRFEQPIPEVQTTEQHFQCISALKCLLTHAQLCRLKNSSFRAKAILIILKFLK